MAERRRPGRASGRAAKQTTRGERGQKRGSAKAAAPKRAGATAVGPAARRKRPTTAKTPRAAKAGAKRALATKPAANGKKAGVTKRSAKGVAKQPSNGTVPRPVVRIRELDPQALCGTGTSVTQLFRVDDLPTGLATVHLVFFDRHGLYCEHGRECPAVAAVRKHTKQTFSTRQGWTGR